MKKNWCLGILAATAAVVAPIFPAKADPIFVSSQQNAQIISNLWTTVNVPAANLTLNRTTLVKARFTAESACYGSSGYCPVRIVYRRLSPSVGPITELNPVVGSDFAFDSTDNGRETTGSWESHAINRSVSLPAGRYQFFVQAGTVGGSATLRLDDMHLELEL